MEKFELLEKYLDGDLSEKEKINFEELLRNDKELQKECDFRKNVDSAILEDDVMNLRQTMTEITQSRSSYSKLKARKLYFSISIAASIIVLLTVGLNIFYLNNDITSREIYDTYYSKYNAICNSRSVIRVESSNVLITSAFDAYSDGDFNTAAQNFEKALSLDAEDVTVKFYLGLCNMELGKYAEAQLLFYDLVKSEDHLFWEQSNWYLALSYLAQDNKPKAKMYFLNIKKQNMCMQNESKIILKLLD